MKKYRIVFNGLRYAVEEQVEAGFYKKRLVWRRTSHSFGGVYFEDRYDTIEEARKRVIALKDEWTVVE